MTSRRAHLEARAGRVLCTGVCTRWGYLLTGVLVPRARGCTLSRRGGTAGGVRVPFARGCRLPRAPADPSLLAAISLGCVQAPYAGGGAGFLGCVQALSKWVHGLGVHADPLQTGACSTACMQAPCRRVHAFWGACKLLANRCRLLGCMKTLCKWMHTLWGA